MLLKNKIFKIVIVSILSILIVTNTGAFKNQTRMNDWYYLYSNYHGNFTTYETPYNDYIFSKDFPDGKFVIPLKVRGAYPQDSVVYRLFKMHPLHFWRWGEYALNWRYRMPYMDWDSVQIRRGFGKLDTSRAYMQF